MMSLYNLTKDTKNLDFKISQGSMSWTPPPPPPGYKEKNGELIFKDINIEGLFHVTDVTFKGLFRHKFMYISLIIESVCMIFLVKVDKYSNYRLGKSI